MSPRAIRGRSQRARLQRVIGGLAEVHPFRWAVQDFEHPEPGWWATPARAAAASCSCSLCEAARAGRDFHLGCIARVAIIRAEQIASAPAHS